MKLTISILLALTISISLNADEFSLIKPYAVEEAPVVTKVESITIIEEKPVVKEVIKEIKKPKIETELKLDDDNDGVINSKDDCPDTSKEFMVDGYGCPQTMILDIKFESNKANLNTELIESLKDFAQFLKDNSGYQVIIYGHTDNTGSKETNKKLSQDRANAVLKGLVRYDIEKFRLTAIGKGDLEPISDNETVEGRAENRRIEIELIQ